MCNSNSRLYIEQVFKPYGVQYIDLGCGSHLSIAFAESQKRESLEGKKVILGGRGYSHLKIYIQLKLF